MITEERLIENIRYVMSIDQWTQRGLASATGIPEGSMYKILSGRRRLRITELAAIAEALQVSADDLLETSGGSTWHGHP